jgi:anti-sigma regulatory factor (Ser/Thr protein kinase)
VTLTPVAPSEAAAEWSWPLAFASTSASAGRDHVTDVLRAFDVDAATVDNARLVASELVGNAVRHARPRPDGHVVMSIAIEDETITIAVGDGGGPSRPAVVRAPVMSLGGLGLRIVQTLSRDWGVRESPDGVTVFAIVNRS